VQIEKKEFSDFKIILHFHGRTRPIIIQIEKEKNSVLRIILHFLWRKTLTILATRGLYRLMMITFKNIDRLKENLAIIAECFSH